jgi:hypothetical protein
MALIDVKLCRPEFITKRVAGSFRGRKPSAIFMAIK